MKTAIIRNFTQIEHLKVHEKGKWQYGPTKFTTMLRAKVNKTSKSTTNVDYNTLTITN
ncbi:hypothetical protein Hanom_Chr00s000003g01601611 [Helianthus anomalus]